MNPFQIELSVRDYECDLQGVVNNAVYLHYLEHARHEYLKHIGINFVDLHKKGINLIVIRSEVDYKYPLRSGDKFVVTVSFFQLSRLRLGADQTIVRLPDKKPIASAKIIWTGINTKGRPCMPDELLQSLKNNN